MIHVSLLVSFISRHSSANGSSSQMIGCSCEPVSQFVEQAEEVETDEPYRIMLLDLAKERKRERERKLYTDHLPTILMLIDDIARVTWSEKSCSLLTAAG